VTKMVKKVKLLEGQLPVLSVACDTIPAAYERCIKYLWDYGVDYRSLNDKKNDNGAYIYPPSRMATMTVTIAWPFKKPMVHRDLKDFNSTQENLPLLIDEDAKKVASKLSPGVRSRHFDQSVYYKSAFGQLLVDDKNELVFNFNVQRTNIDIGWFWARGVLLGATIQKRVAEILTEKIGDCLVKPGRYSEYYSLLRIPGNIIDNAFLKRFNEMLLEPISNRVLDKKE